MAMEVLTINFIGHKLPCKIQRFDLIQKKATKVTFPKKWVKVRWKQQFSKKYAIFINFKKVHKKYEIIV